MRAGLLSERIGFQLNTTTSDSQGGRASSWATFASLWGQVLPLNGRETLEAAAIGSTLQYRVTVAAQQLQAANVTVSSITRSGTTATVTTSAAHGLTTNDYVRIAGAVQTAYNGQFQVTVSTTTVFTYTVSGSPATPATGTITSARLLLISSKLRLSWTPSWDAAQAARTLQIQAIRLLGRDWLELDCGETV